MIKVGIVGAGQVGSSAATFLVRSGLAQVVLVDIKGDLSKGKSLDLEDLCGGSQAKLGITPSRYLKGLKDADVIVITAGATRSAGMQRKELLDINGKIVESICKDLKKMYFRGILVMVTNPLDVMTYIAYKTLGLPRERVFGMGQILDTLRLKGIISRILDISPQSIDCMVIGQHGEHMVPLLERARVGTVPLKELVSEAKFKNIKEELVQRGAKIVSFLGKGSAYIAPGFAIFQIIKSVILDEKRVIPVSVSLEGEHNQRGLCIGYPCVISRKGARIFPLKFSSSEREQFLSSCRQVRSIIKACMI